VSQQDRLREVKSKGGPAQSVQAALLLEQLRRQPQAYDLAAEIDVLFDAYLNDPHMSRNE
jgi:hypothetical protein